MKNALAFGMLVFAIFIVIAIEAVLLRWQRVLLIIAAIIVLVLSVNFARAHDYGQFENSDPVIHEWYQALMQPDNPTVSCCGEADAYWADEVHVRDGKAFAVITDDRDDAPLRRPHKEVGEEFEIPPYKMNKDANPTGHNVVFLSSLGYVFCFISGTGI